MQNIIEFRTVNIVTVNCRRSLFSYNQILYNITLEEKSAHNNKSKCSARDVKYCVRWCVLCYIRIILYDIIIYTADVLCFMYFRYRTIAIIILYIYILVRSGQSGGRTPGYCSQKYFEKYIFFISDIIINDYSLYKFSLRKIIPTYFVQLKFTNF